MDGEAGKTLRLAVLVALMAGLAACGGTGSETADPGAKSNVRFNEIQVVASHNSYHVEPEPVLFDALKEFLGDEADGLEYTHRPLAEEFDAGVRQIELDVFVDDPDGGRFATPKLVPVFDLDPVDPRMTEPGLKVFHIQEVDYRSTCPTFTDCLTQVRTWSDENPDHLPIVIQIEAKDGDIPDPGFDFVAPLRWTADTFGELEAEIASVFPRKRILAPSDVKGGSPTLAEAVQTRGWPKLSDVRGQVAFMLDDKGAKLEAYRSAVPDLADRTIFVDVPESDDDAAMTVVNDPIEQAEHIRAATSGRPRHQGVGPMTATRTVPGTRPSAWC